MAHAVADTSVIAHLTKISRHSFAYRRVFSTLKLAISFHTIAELLVADYGAPRQRRVDVLFASAVSLPHSLATSRWYAEAIRTRRELKTARERGGDAGDADVWIIASALEFGMILASHDTQQVTLARAMGLSTFTMLPQYRAGNPA